jgi:O-antigen ligase
MRRIAFWFLWAAVFAIPWENVIRLEGLGTLSRLVGMIAAAAGIAAVVLAREVRRPNSLLIGMAVFVLWSGVTVFWTIDPHLSFMRLFTYAQLFVLVWLVHEFASEPRQLRSLMQAFVLGAWVAVGNSLTNFALGQATTYMRFGAAGFDPGDFGLTVALALPFAWHIGITESNRGLRWLYLGYMPAAVLSILLSASRGPFVAMGIALLIVLWTYPRLRLLPKALVFAAAIAGAFAVPAVVPGESFARLRRGVDEVQEGTLEGRGQIWQAGIEVFREHSVVGVGVGAFRRSVENRLGRAWAAHNTFLAVAVESGVIGLVIFLILILLTLRVIWDLPPPERRLWLILGITWFVGVMNLSWQYRKPTWLLLALLAAHAVAMRSQSLRRQEEETV